MGVDGSLVFLPSSLLIYLQKDVELPPPPPRSHASVLPLLQTPSILATPSRTGGEGKYAKHKMDITHPYIVKYVQQT